jgi:hypothetical protein
MVRSATSCITDVSEFRDPRSEIPGFAPDGADADRNVRISSSNPEQYSGVAHLNDSPDFLNTMQVTCGLPSNLIAQQNFQRRWPSQRGLPPSWHHMPPFQGIRHTIEESPVRYIKAMGGINLRDGSIRPR